MRDSNFSPGHRARATYKISDDNMDNMDNMANIDKEASTRLEAQGLSGFLNNVYIRGVGWGSILATIDIFSNFAEKWLNVFFLIFSMELEINEGYNLRQVPFSWAISLGRYRVQKEQRIWPI